VRQPEGRDDVILDALRVRRLTVLEDFRGVVLWCNGYRGVFGLEYMVNPDHRETGGAIELFCSACGQRVKRERNIGLYHFLDTIRCALNAWEAWQVEMRMRQERRDKETRWIATQLARHFVPPTEPAPKAPKPLSRDQRRAIANRQNGWDPKRYATV
jgi:hypothetical protein